MFGSASLVVSPGSSMSTAYLSKLTSINEKLEESQTSVDTVRRLHDELRDLQISFGDWQKSQTEHLVNDFTETVSQVVSLCETSLSSQEETCDRLTGMQTRLSRARDCNDLVEIRQILKREVEEAQKVIEKQKVVRTQSVEEFKGLVRELESRIQKAEEAAQTDHLTALGNRAAFQFYVEATIQKVRSGEGPYSVAVMDLDGFKPINDTYGHDAGDLALNAFAGRLRRTFPRPFFVGRIGGDEFVVVASISKRDLLKRCGRLNEDLRQHPVSIDRSGKSIVLKFGVSFGTAEITATQSLEASLHEADQSMYEQKRAKKAA